MSKKIRQKKVKKFRCNVLFRRCIFSRIRVFRYIARKEKPSLALFIITRQFLVLHLSSIPYQERNKLSLSEHI